MTCELSDICNQGDCNEEIHTKPTTNLFGTYCKTCGQTSCYADDTTYSVSAETTEELQEKITMNLKQISEHLNANELKINEDKTTLMLMMTRQKRATMTTEQQNIHIIADNGETVSRSEETVLLGLTLDQNMEWKKHLETGQEAMLSKLRRKLGGLKLVGKHLTKRSKLQLVNRIIMSKIGYMIEIWGDTKFQKNVMTKIQRLQNTAAKFVPGKGRRTPTKQLMEECNWMSIRQLAAYCSILSLWKVVNLGQPECLRSKILTVEDKEKRTRKLMGGGLESKDQPELEIVKRSWRWRAIILWNDLPRNLREEKDILSMKRDLKEHIKQNIPTHIHG